MKKKMFLLIGLTIIPLTACTVSFVNNPSGSFYDGSSTSSEPSEPSYIESVNIPDGLDSYTIRFNANHVTTQPKFQTKEQVEEAIKLYDTENVIANVTTFENVAYGPTCLVINELGVQIRDDFSYSYVSISATPFYTRNLDHLSGEYVFTVSKGALDLNNLGFISLKETHTDYLMEDTICSYETNSKQLTLSSWNNPIFINSITFYF